MTPEYFESYVLEVTHQDLIQLCRTKGVEYAGKEDKLANFKKTAEECGSDPMQVLYIFMNKHYNAIQSYIRDKKVYSEPITGRIRDCQLYLALLEGLILEANSGNPNPQLGARDEDREELKLHPYRVLINGRPINVTLTRSEAKYYDENKELPAEALVRNQLRIPEGDSRN